MFGCKQASQASIIICSQASSCALGTMDMQMPRPQCGEACGGWGGGLGNVGLVPNSLW